LDLWSPSRGSSRTAVAIPGGEGKSIARSGKVERPVNLHRRWAGICPLVDCVNLGGLSACHALDDELSEPTELHRFGGFVIAEQYDLARSTADIDILGSLGTDPGTIFRLAGKGSIAYTSTLLASLRCRRITRTVSRLCLRGSSRDP